MFKILKKPERSGAFIPSSLSNVHPTCTVVKPRRRVEDFLGEDLLQAFQHAAERGVGAGGRHRVIPCASLFSGSLAQRSPGRGVALQVVYLKGKL
jgi:hypothetical protein